MTTTLDALGLRCPLPVLRTARILRGLTPGDTLRVSTDDPVAVIDMPHFCAEAGHEILSAIEDGAVTHWTIRRGADLPEG